MSKSKDINQKKQEILSQINDLKVRFNILTQVNRQIVEEKKQGFGLDFHKKDIKEKKRDIMKIIQKEDQLLGLREEHFDRKK